MIEYDFDIKYENAISKSFWKLTEMKAAVKYEYYNFNGYFNNHLSRIGKLYDQRSYFHSKFVDIIIYLSLLIHWLGKYQEGDVSSFNTISRANKFILKNCVFSCKIQFKKNMHLYRLVQIFLSKMKRQCHLRCLKHVKWVTQVLYVECIIQNIKILVHLYFKRPFLFDHEQQFS